MVQFVKNFEGLFPAIIIEGVLQYFENVERVISSHIDEEVALNFLTLECSLACSEC